MGVEQKLSGEETRTGSQSDRLYCRVCKTVKHEFWWDCPDLDRRQVNYQFRFRGGSPTPSSLMPGEATGE